MLETIKDFFQQYWGQIISLVGTAGAIALGKIIYNGFKLLANVTSLRLQINKFETKMILLEKRLEKIENDQQELPKVIANNTYNAKTKNALNEFSERYKVHDTTAVETIEATTKKYKARRKR